MFIFKVSTMWKAFKKHMPALYKAFKSVKTNEEIPTIYSSLESISIDYGVMERADNIYVIPSDFGWSDVGSWDAFYELAKKDKNGNYAQGNVIFRDAHNCGVFSNGIPVVITHLDDIIVVVDENGVLVTRRGTTQDVKNVRFE